MEATGQIRQASQNQAFEAVKARVITRAFGIRLGGFGVDYSSKQVVVDQDGQTGGAKRDTTGQAFETEIERERLREQMSAAQPGDSASDPQQASSPQDPMWRRGLTAYAKARDVLLLDAARSGSTRLAVA